MKGALVVTAVALLLVGCGSTAAPVTQRRAQSSPSSTPAISQRSAHDCTVAAIGSSALVNYQGSSARALCTSAASVSGIPLPGDQNIYSFLSLPDNPTDSVVCQLRAASDGTTATVMDTGQQLVGENLCAYMLQS